MPEQSADLKTIQDAIKTDAPRLAALLNGPNEAVALRALGKALLDDTEATSAEIAAAAPSADKLKIQAAEQEALLRLQQSNPASSGTDRSDASRQPSIDPAAAADAENARKMLITNHDWTNRWLAFIVTALFFILIGCLIYLSWYSMKHNTDLRNLDPAFRDILFTLLGVVATGWANIIGFYFGSSAGSMQKSLTINAALDKTIAQTVQDGS